MSNLKTQNHNLNPKANLRHRSYHFSLNCIKFMGELPNQKVFWVICDQLLRSSTSIGANLVEAKSSSSRKDFIKFYEIALKSSNETKYWLCLLRDGTNIEKDRLTNLLNEVEEISNMIGSSLLTLKGKKF